MMNDLQIFENTNLGKVRLFDNDGRVEFVGKDVCDALGYQNATVAMNNHCRGEAKYLPVQTEGGMQDMRVISEPDLYRLVAGSTLPEAIKFEAWVFEEVLPSIRKTGGYHIPAAEWRRLTDHMIQKMDSFFHRADPRIRELDHRHMNGWKELMLDMVEEAKWEKFEAINKLAVVKNAYNDLLKDDFAGEKLIEQEERRWKRPPRKAYLGSRTGS
jgi:prophage antirepressor-like protein